MKKNKLLKHPVYTIKDLGKSIPQDPHAVSVCLPNWQSIIDYEERKPEIIERLELGYPRFIYHPSIIKVHKKFTTNPDFEIQLYPTKKIAQRAYTFLISKFPNEPITINDRLGFCILEFPKHCLNEAMYYWQHTGEGISSRQADAIFHHKNKGAIEESYGLLQKRVADVFNSSISDIYLFPSGMAAINMSMLILKKIFIDRSFVQFSFPYGDTLKLLEKFNKKRTHFLPRGDEVDLVNLEELLIKENIAGLFTEIPSNPLLASVDLHRLRSLANTYHFPIVVDETLGACINMKARGFSDISTISLTKYFSGEGNVMGGALILHPDQPYYPILKPLLENMHEKNMCNIEDLDVLNKNSMNLKDRINSINNYASQIVDFLRQDKRIDSVYYPKITDNEIYERYIKPDGGYGGVLSFTLKKPEIKTPVFYDNLKISKGPNLGASYSLCCPFVMLAHYNELQWAEDMGASRWLIRLSIGLEPPKEIIKRIKQALDKSV